MYEIWFVCWYFHHRWLLNWSIIDRDNFIAVWFRINSVDFDLTNAEKSANDGDDLIERAHVLHTGAKLLLYKPGRWTPRSIQRMQKFSPHRQQLYYEKKNIDQMYFYVFLLTFRWAESNGNEHAQCTGAWYDRQSKAMEFNSKAIRSNVGKSFVSILDWCWSVNGDGEVFRCGE